MADLDLTLDEIIERRRRAAAIDRRHERSGEVTFGETVIFMRDQWDTPGPTPPFPRPVSPPPRIQNTYHNFQSLEEIVAATGRRVAPETIARRAGHGGGQSSQEVERPRGRGIRFIPPSLPDEHVDSRQRPRDSPPFTRTFGSRLGLGYHSRFRPISAAERDKEYDRLQEMPQRRPPPYDCLDSDSDDDEDPFEEIRDLLRNKRECKGGWAAYTREPLEAREAMDIEAKASLDVQTVRGATRGLLGVNAEVTFRQKRKVTWQDLVGHNVDAAVPREPDGLASMQEEFPIFRGSEDMIDFDPEDLNDAPLLTGGLVRRRPATPDEMVVRAPEGVSGDERRLPGQQVTLRKMDPIGIALDDMIARDEDRSRQNNRPIPGVTLRQINPLVSSLDEMIVRDEGASGEQEPTGIRPSLAKGSLKPGRGRAIRRGVTLNKKNPMETALDDLIVRGGEDIVSAVPSNSSNGSKRKVEQMDVEPNNQVTEDQKPSVEKAKKTSTKIKLVRFASICEVDESQKVEKVILTPAKVMLDKSRYTYTSESQPGTSKSAFENAPLKMETELSGSEEEKSADPVPKTKTSRPVIKLDKDPVTSTEKDVQQMEVVAVAGSAGNVAKQPKQGGNQPRKHPLTPYRAVGALTERGMIIEMRIGFQKDPPSNPLHRWRCIIKCGEVEGVADSLRKVVAREMASVEFLTKLREAYNHVVIPRYEVHEEMFTDPRIFHQLERIGVEKNVQVSNEVRLRPQPGQGGGTAYTHVCTYFVDTKRFTGTHFNLDYAKVVAARKAYEYLTGRSYHLTKYFTGEDCDSSEEYIFNESESYQSVELVGSQEAQAFQGDPQEAQIENVRRQVQENFARAQRDDQERRRNMPVSFP